MMRFRFLPPDPTLPDGFSKDGEIALTVNSLYRDGEIIPSRQFTGPAATQEVDGRRLLCTHRTPAALNHIFLVDEKGRSSLFYSSTASHTPSDSSPSQVIKIGQTDSVVDATPVGSIVVLVTSDGLRYLVWSSEGYSILGHHPPEAPLCFGMFKVGQLSDRTTLEVDRSCVPVFHTAATASSDSSGDGGFVTRGGWSTDSARNPPTRAALTELAQLLNAHLDQAIDRIVCTNGYLWQPFFIRYAYRLFDGSYIFHSQPILMTPTATVPRISLSEVTDGEDEERRRVVTTLQVPYFQLTAHLLPTEDSDRLSEWRDLIAGIDIFVSAPIPTYCPTLPLSGVPYCGERQFFSSAVPGRTRSTSVEPSSPTLPEPVFIGRYSESTTENYSDHYVDLSTLSDEKVYWNIPVNPDFDRMVVENHRFNLVAHIPIESFLGLEKPAEIPILLPPPTDGSQSITDSIPHSLTDDWKSRWEIIPSCSCRLNGRLILGGISMRIPDPLPLPDFDGPTLRDDTDPVETIITASSRAGGITNRSKRSFTFSSSSLSESFPRYLYYPDRSANQLTIHRPGEGTYTLPLTPHPYLNGAYFYGRLQPSDLLAQRYKKVEQSNATQPTDDNNPSSSLLLHFDSLIMASNEYNPLYLPITMSANIVDGPVRAFCPVSFPTSQTSSANLQLYAFSCSGIWTVGLSTDGRLFLSRRVALPFAGPGTIKAIAAPFGAVLSCDGRLWQLIDNDIRALPSPPWRLLKEIGLMGSTAKEQARLISYDSSNQQVIFSIPDSADRLVYSLPNSLWGLLQGDSTATNKSRILTRPIRLDSEALPARLKDIRVEGYIPDLRSLNVTLQGSNDLTHWRSILSGPSNLDTILGSPSRYYRLVITFPSTPTHSLQGLTISSTK